MAAARELLWGLFALGLVVLLFIAARRRFGQGDAATGPHDVGLD